MQLLLAVFFTTILCFANNNLVYGQQDGPPPPRLNIPGAFPVSGPVRPQFRNNERLNNAGPLIRIRKPNSRPNISIQPQQDAKPVTEEPEDIPNTFIPQIVQQQQDQRQALFQSEQNSIQIDDSADEKPIPRFQERPAPQQQQNRFPPELQGFGPQINNAGGAQRFAINTERPPPPKPTTLRARTIFREPPKQQYEPEPVQNVRPQARYNIQPRPQQHNPISHEDRNKKPVAQILRKYREENEDGSITWGFENDDGSFKEETIGIDCVTRGRYGYVDPDGLKREYNYETGILCDPNKRNQHQDEDENQRQTGYVNYENNKAILPNGVEIDLASMGKKKSKRPGAILTNPQQFYSRN